MLDKSYNFNTNYDEKVKSSIGNDEKYGRSLGIGLINFLIRVSSLKNESLDALKDYIQVGTLESDKISIEEEVTRLLVIASTSSYQLSPQEYLANTFYQGRLEDSASSFLLSNISGNNYFENEYDSYFETGSFQNMMGDLDLVCLNYDEGLMSEIFNQISLYYSKRLEYKMDDRMMDLRSYEPLIDLFGYNVRVAEEKIRGVNSYENKRQY